MMLMLYQNDLENLKLQKGQKEFQLQMSLERF